ncbi:tetratricopeptide repeat protein [Elizabethkingia anophelis]|uniref:tetratricopeptide repeat protein n=2 Tax=Elizabethkingia anophelis TaxID=1117645 RepID=UPI0012B236A8|nr:tetratricopeptide repeat protein [Elizabethkingia anophelis]QGN24268.1 tetratricopeptide repeat protein [Elizabethkingia anophelis]QNV10909.1 tetratricopeptide repeat protein [Elizabethkingia anophelis]UTF89063.1 tetratricopeptide repeat protein [Elizabethkingia anophelis]UTF99985.1 tetratricopeptide repeat protein [Elizabethkingia anophelis]UTG03700.1 tetratricopeptide repeat protein [Elizabethkingia anophelis]
MSDICMNHIERYWQALTVANNETFNKGDFEKALTGYKDALYRAEVLNNHISDCIRLKIPFIQVYIISCNNLANTYEELGKLEEAENMLKRTVYYLLHLAGNKELNMDEIQSELKRATLSYVRFAEKTNSGKVKQEQLFRTLKEQLVENNLIKID